MINKVSELEQVFLDKFWLCLQCLVVSGVLRKISLSLMPSEAKNKMAEKGLVVSGQEALLLVKKPGILKALLLISSVGKRRAQAKSRNGQ